MGNQWKWTGWGTEQRNMWKYTAFQLQFLLRSDKSNKSENMGTDRVSDMLTLPKASQPRALTIILASCSFLRQTLMEA